MNKKILITGGCRSGKSSHALHLADHLIDHIKLAWSGLWSERAINRNSFIVRDPKEIGGGIIIQKNISPRVSGVLQTVNVSQHEMQEMIINAGLGIAEGSVY